jgi:hypothetical protein
MQEMQACAVAAQRYPAMIPILPVRDRWRMGRCKVGYTSRPGEVRAAALLCARWFDLQTPVACSQERMHHIPAAVMVVFEHSGDYSFLVERE